MSCDPICFVDVIEADEPAFVEVVVEADPAFAEILVPGEPGASAYAVWLGEGHTGTPADFLASLAGKDASVQPLARPAAGETIRAGQAVTLDRITGRAMLASAAVYARAFVAGFAQADADVDHPISIVGRLLTLDDWSAAFGAADLPAGMSLFLATEPGRIATQPVTEAGLSTVAVGFAAGPRTLAISFSTPILR